MNTEYPLMDIVCQNRRVQIFLGFGGLRTLLTELAEAEAVAALQA